MRNHIKEVCAVLSFGFVLFSCDESSGPGLGLLPKCQEPSLAPPLLVDDLFSSASANSPRIQLGQDEPIRSKRYLVKMSGKFQATAAARDSREKLSQASPAHVDEIRPDLLSVEFDDERDSIEVRDLLSVEGVEYVEPDYPIHLMFQSNDPKLSSQWAHEVVRSAQAWDVSRGNHSVIVAVIDSGVDYLHSDLAGNIWKNPDEVLDGLDNDGNGLVDDIRGWNFAGNNSNVVADDRSYHGTHVAGTVGAVGNNGVGVSGHAQSVQILPIKFLSSSGSGYTSDAIRGMDYAISKKARIISSSWGSRNYSQAMIDALERVRIAGAIFVAAAGNNGTSNDSTGFYPSGYPHSNIVAVASSGKTDVLSRFSNYGAKTVDLAAPGESITSTKNGNAYQTISGTSMATPLVSGVLATMVALRPDLSNVDLIQALLDTVDKVPSMSGKLVSGGRINSARALQRIQRSGSGPGSSQCMI